MSDKTDLILIGATGFTGRLIARHLGAHPDFAAGRFTFSIAGRAPKRLAEVAADLGLSADRVPAVQVDVLDASSVASAVGSARVVINAVGPFWKWGKLVAKACAEQGVHYVDLTGEPPFIKWVIDECHALAQASGAVLIPAAGHDCVPSDLTVHIANGALKAAAPGAGGALAHSMSAFALKGGVSAGTLETFMTMLEDVPPAQRRAAMKPFAFAPMKGARQPNYQLSYELPLHPHIIGCVYPMASVDRLVVQRTWALLENARSSAVPEDADAAARRAYGSALVYDEFVKTPSAYGKLGASAFSLGFGLLVAACAFAPVRWLFRKLFITAGAGPSEKTLQTGSITVTNVSTGAGGVRVRTTFRGRGEPGYFLAAVEIAECALALALQREALPPLGRAGGVLTPASALGNVLVHRLEATGRFEFASEVIAGDGHAGSA